MKELETLAEELQAKATMKEDKALFMPENHGRGRDRDNHKFICSRGPRHGNNRI